MLIEMLPVEQLAELRKAIYSGEGYYVLRRFLQPEHATYLVDHWRTRHNPVVITRGFDKSRLFFDGCPNYSLLDPGRSVHFNFFWNSPNDTLSYDAAWRIQRLRNQIEGNSASENYLALSNANMPQPHITDGVASATSYRVVGTVDGGSIESHRDWVHDPSKVQMSLVLSSKGHDYGEGGFLFRKRDGSLVNLSQEENLQRGDLLVFRYSMDHGVEAVKSAPGQVGFWRMLFPIETIRSDRPGSGTGKPQKKVSALRRLASRLRRQLPAAAPGARGAEAEQQSIMSDPQLASLAEIAIESGCAPSEVFFKKGLFARWHVMQRWQMEALQQIGLQKEHRFLDIGCGVGRLAMLLIPYLESDRYFGTDPVRAYIETARRYADDVLKTTRKYSLLLDHSFEFARFGVKFDYAMAHSVFTHMTPAEIEGCLRRLAPVMAPGGKLLFTVALDRSLREDYKEAFVYNAELPMVRTHHASDAFFKPLAEEIGFRLDLLPMPKHPSQTAFVATFRGSAA
jgi:SAM-dependent methyltransferase